MALPEGANTAGIAVLATLLFCGLGAADTGGKPVNNDATRHKHTNRLIDENSPYLLQHAHNPVNWYPWGEEAFERAKKEDKPIFLSIGYSTCHWCHVMERESFENERTAKIMNENFVCIKVDREQRPDVDAVYMNAVQMMTGSGGWPLSVFLTPEGKPFYGGTYFPPEDLFGRPSFKRVLLAVADRWRQQREELTESAGKITDALSGLGAQSESQGLSLELLAGAYEYLKRSFDKTNGGFGGAPKFPSPTNLTLLLNYWHRTGDEEALRMVEATLEAMSRGGIYDHVGGGFHRYSTDARWLVPHFEKMLYDQALLSKVYIQAYQATGKQDYARVAREIFDYVLRDMTDAKGGFYSAEDADSEGEEGRFYVWEPAEVKRVIGPERTEIFNTYYGVTDKGNFEHGRSILNVTGTVEKLAKGLGREARELGRLLAEGRSKMLKHRAKRIRPHRDDKVIVAWNGLMISSMAYGGAVLQEEKYIEAASRAAGFVLGTLREKGQLMRYYRGGETVGPAFLDDYAFTIGGLLDLYEATFEVKWLAEAKQLAERMIELYGSGDGSFYLSAEDRLIVRSRSAYDGAIPSGNSVAALVLLRLGRTIMDQQYGRRGEQVVKAFSGQMAQSPASLTAMLAAVDFFLGPTQEIVIAGAPGRVDTKQMLSAIRKRFLPNAVILVHPTGSAGEAIEKLVPFIKGQAAIDDKATAYVCENYVCEQPVTSAGELEELLAAKRDGDKRQN